jgi:hypothetical protein
MEPFIIIITYIAPVIFCIFILIKGLLKYLGDSNSVLRDTMTKVGTGATIKPVSIKRYIP